MSGAGKVVREMEELVRVSSQAAKAAFQAARRLDLATVDALLSANATNLARSNTARASLLAESERVQTQVRSQLQRAVDETARAISLRAEDVRGGWTSVVAAQACIESLEEVWLNEHIASVETQARESANNQRPQH